MIDEGIITHLILRVYEGLLKPSTVIGREFGTKTKASKKHPQAKKRTLYILEAIRSPANTGLELTHTQIYIFSLYTPHRRRFVSINEFSRNISINNRDCAGHCSNN